MLKNYQMMHLSARVKNSLFAFCLLLNGGELFAAEDLVLREGLHSKVTGILGVPISEVFVDSGESFLVLSYKVAEKEFVFWLRKSKDLIILDVGSKSLDDESSVVNSRHLSGDESKEIFDLVRITEILSLPEKGVNEDTSENYFVYLAGKIDSGKQPKYLVRDIFESRVFDQLITKVWLLAHRKGTGWRVIERKNR